MERLTTSGGRPTTVPQRLIAIVPVCIFEAVEGRGTFVRAVPWSAVCGAVSPASIRLHANRCPVPTPGFPLETDILTFAGPRSA